MCMHIFNAYVYPGSPPWEDYVRAFTLNSSPDLERRGQLGGGDVAADPIQINVIQVHTISGTRPGYVYSFTAAAAAVAGATYSIRSYYTIEISVCSRPQIHQKRQ